MVGRRRVKKRLYGLLTNSETRTGSYIITGFRGVGKTSLVNQVINQLQPRTVIFKQAAAVLFTWALIHIIFKVAYLPVWSAVLIILFIGIVYWFNALLNLVLRKTSLHYDQQEAFRRKMTLADYKNREKELNKLKWNRFLNRLNHRLYTFFLLDFDYYKHSNADKVAFLLCYATLIEFLITVLTILPRVLIPTSLIVATIGGIVILSTKVEVRKKFFSGPYLKTIAFLCGWLFVLTLLTEIVYWFDFFLAPNPDGILTIGRLSLLLFFIVILSWFSRSLIDYIDSNKAKVLRQETEGFVNMIKQKLNHSQKIFVRLSFPQEVITSKDMLKSLVQNMSKELNRYAGFNRIVTRFIFGFMVWLMASWLYHVPLIKEGMDTFKDLSRVS